MLYEDLIDELYAASNSPIGLSIRFQMACVLHLALWGFAILATLLGTLVTYDKSSAFLLFWGAALIYAIYRGCVWIGNFWAISSGKFIGPEGYARLCAYFNVPSGEEPRVDTRPTDPYIARVRNEPAESERNVARAHRATRRHTDNDD